MNKQFLLLTCDTDLTQYFFDPMFIRVSGCSTFEWE